jgi:hypothetical protein
MQEAIAKTVVAKRVGERRANWDTITPVVLDAQVVRGESARGRASLNRFKFVFKRSSPYELPTRVRRVYLRTPSAHNPSDDPTRRRKLQTEGAAQVARG